MVTVYGEKYWKKAFICFTYTPIGNIYDPYRCEFAWYFMGLYPYLLLMCVLFADQCASCEKQYLILLDLNHDWEYLYKIKRDFIIYYRTGIVYYNSVIYISINCIPNISVAVLFLFFALLLWMPPQRYYYVFIIHHFILFLFLWYSFCCVLCLCCWNGFCSSPSLIFSPLHSLFFFLTHQSVNKNAE